ncbi:MAG: hypothetical protein J5I93_08435 [Pirellulaceae bacterium]|nr:hypothetical protein [Pirellulaceae bacterium]
MRERHRRKPTRNCAGLDHPGANCLLPARGRPGPSILAAVTWGMILLALGTTPAGGQEPMPVILKSDVGKFQLLRGGQPYFIQGVGGDSRLDQLAAAGGNSIRTWGTERLAEILDQAHQQRLTVCVGLWLGHERHGFDYQDQTAVLQQLNASLDTVRKFKDHPAVLLWAVGNEMEGSGANPAIWYAVDHIAREIKQLDPHHPTLTVIAELGEGKLKSIERFCPHIDIVGVNSYGGISTLAKRYRAAGGSKPYIVTEFGPLGPWEVGKTPWGSSLEATSTEKARQYSDGYQQAVASQRDLCLGSYAFLWGHKQETTATWFGMLLPDGSRLEAVDAMTQAWTGKVPENRCPRIEALRLDRTSGLKPGEQLEARLTAGDPDQDPLTVRWLLRLDSGTLGAGGDAQAEEPSLADAVAGRGHEATLTVPRGGGGYRLFAYVHDGRGGAAVANVPLHVDAPVIPLPASKARLPLVLYADGANNSTYIPSGYMGNTQAIQMTLDCPDQPHSGKTCLKVEYQAADNWGGVLWQSPANDWEGKLPGGLDLSGAGALEFWARGAAGGETVNFVVGSSGTAGPYRDSAKLELNDVRLTTEWQKLRIPLDKADLRRIKAGFGWSLAGQGKPVTFYLDDVRYVAE